MAKDPKALLQEFHNGIGALSKIDAARTQGFMDFMEVVEKPGALDLKTKEIICAAIGVTVRCDYCIVYHTYQALKAGATRQELIEAAFTACVMGGGPTVTYSSTLFLDAINAFAPEFEK
ncbi:MAG: carboxymuconolactone decarboxylase family protein [Dehalococcoidales bacterium]|nr:carboxymuconolactone decarboxylase family protein [Dehalococcoidales bacterium]